MGVKIVVITIGGHFAILSNINVHPLSSTHTLACKCPSEDFASGGRPSVSKPVHCSIACDSKMTGYYKAVKMNV